MEDCYLQLLIRTIHYNLYCNRGKYSTGWLNFKQCPFLRTYFWRSLSTEGNLRFKIDWASLIVGRKFAVFASFYFVFEGNFQVQAPGRAYIWPEARFNEGFFCVTSFGGLYMEGLIFGILR